MSKCPFLTTSEEYVACFKECVFQNWSENNGKCPFKTLKNVKRFDMRDLYEYDAFSSDNESPLALLYGTYK